MSKILFKISSARAVSSIRNQARKRPLQLVLDAKASKYRLKLSTKSKIFNLCRFSTFTFMLLSVGSFHCH